MNKVVDIQLAGHAAPHRLHDDACDALARYLDLARTRLAGDPDQDEVMGDLERSIGAKLSERAGPAGRILSRDDVTAVLEEVGPIAAGESERVAVPGSRPRRRRLYRVLEGQEITGVCTGLAVYSEIRVDYIRWVFVGLALVTGGLFAIGYFIAALILPVVSTREEWVARMEADAATATAR